MLSFNRPGLAPALGLLLGKISKKNLMLRGIKTVTANALILYKHARFWKHANIINANHFQEAK